MTQERFINRNMETCRRSQARQRRMGESQRDHFEMQTAQLSKQKPDFLEGHYVTASPD